MGGGRAIGGGAARSMSDAARRVRDRKIATSQAERRRMRPNRMRPGIVPNSDDRIAIAAAV
ncbi:hypothetical protein [Burkholderia sp. MSMB1498]|uniref:hypothetical protein n=1 Tax=Burkholderia sp. MSMB1498 TaxID=1637842 RepID=UPI0007567288|nr:hypothetical protein [Burkholderia sp. MSMB1498]KVK73563.1 hypothetical protein WS91_19625 [Burkholderia sp. MSMB1498]